jgi:hypothetical protein
LSVTFGSFSTKKTGCPDIDEILLIVALDAITLTQYDAIFHKMAMNNNYIIFHPTMNGIRTHNVSGDRQ